jgi:hypothetical protein
VNLLERINKDECYYVHYDNFIKKWGEQRYVFRSIPGSDDKLMVNELDEALSPDQIKQKNKEFIDALKADELHKQRDVDMLFDTMKKYYSRWWD